ncbi:MAG: hypothetical protein JWM37_377 [Candidatus Saccharibacteria bacterium]|nr:hypothetical protein [Candidatus Saccharibacteria bacterium]
MAEAIEPKGGCDPLFPEVMLIPAYHEDPAEAKYMMHWGLQHYVVLQIDGQIEHDPKHPYIIYDKDARFNIIAEAIRHEAPDEETATEMIDQALGYALAGQLEILPWARQMFGEPDEDS